MSIRYTESLEGVDANALAGFFTDWLTPLTPDRHLEVLRGSSHVVLAIEEDDGQVVGFITAVSDGCFSAFIPLLEVLPGYRGNGVGRELVERMLKLLNDYRCIDLVCDPPLQSFYEKLGMQRCTAMIARNRDG